MANTTFLAGGRRRKLFRRKTSGPWHVRFEHRGRPFQYSLRTTLDYVAKEKAKQIIEARINGECIDQDASFDELIKRFLASRQAKAKHTRENDEAFATTLRSTFTTHTPARQVRTGDILAWLHAQAQLRKWRNRTFNHYRLWLKQIFDLAVADRLLTRDQHPFAGKLIHRKRPEPVSRNVPTADQFERIIADVRANDGDEIGDFLEFLGLAGVGQAEAAELRKCDVVGNKMKFIRRKTGVPFQVPVYAWLAPLIQRRIEQTNGDADRVFNVNEAGGSGCQ